METLIRHLKDVYKLETEVVKAQTKGLKPFEPSNNKERLRPDLVISAGGDGTFLEAASLIPADQLSDTPIWLAGLNTDPERSLGSLCMSFFGPKNEQHFNCGYYDYEKCQPEPVHSNVPDSKPPIHSKTFDKNLKDFCSYTYKRQTEKKINFIDNLPVHVQNDKPSTTQSDLHLVSYDEYIRVLLNNLLKFNLHPIPRQRLRLKVFKRKMLNYNPPNVDDKKESTVSPNFDNRAIENILVKNTSSNFDEDELTNGNLSNDSSTYTFPRGVVNDVMISGEDFGKSFYAIVQVDDKPLKRVKCSGVLVSTGTGSTAWAYNICKMNFFNGTSLIKCLLEHPSLSNSLDSSISEEVIKETIECFNQKLKMDPSLSLMRCIIREEISNKTTDDTSFYNCKQVKVLPLCKNSVVCADGSKNIRLDYGDVVILKTFESDLIWSLI